MKKTSIALFVAGAALFSSCVAPYKTKISELEKQNLDLTQRAESAETKLQSIETEMASKKAAANFFVANPYLSKMIPHLKNYDGSAYDQKNAISGGAIMVYYSASWCGPCRAITPKLVKQFEEFKKMGLNVVLGGADRTEAKMVDYMKHYKMPWPGVSREHLSKLGLNEFKGRGIPHVALLTAKGELIEKGHPAYLNKMLAKLPKK